MTDSAVFPDLWPLRRGDTLSNHDWFPFFGHRFLSSAFAAEVVMEGRRAEGFTAVLLWCEAMRQDPAGTLPTREIELAQLARFPTVSEWSDAREVALHGWVEVLVEDPRDGATETRLGHPFLEQVVTEMHKRKRGRVGAREAANVATRKSRIRAKMKILRVPDHVMADENAIEALAEHFGHSDLYITPDNVRAAMIEVLGYTGEVARFPRRPGRGAG